MSFLTMIINAFPFIAGFLIAGRMKQEGYLLVAVIVVALCALLLLGMPFWGVWCEAILGVAATLAFIPVYLCIPFGRHENRVRLYPRVVFVLLLPLIVAIMMPWTYRVDYAVGVTWACDGPIASKYMSNGGNKAILEVQCSRGMVTLEGVDVALWQQARVGNWVQKPKGSAFGALDGKPIRVVPRYLPWWNEPGSP